MNRTTAFAVSTIVAMSTALGGCGMHYQLAEPIANIARTGLVKDRKQLSRLEKAATDGEIEACGQEEADRVADHMGPEIELRPTMTT